MRACHSSDRKAQNLAKMLGAGTLHDGLYSSSFLGLPYRNLNINHKKEVLRSPWLKQCRTSMGTRNVALGDGDTGPRRYDKIKIPVIL